MANDNQIIKYNYMNENIEIIYKFNFDLENVNCFIFNSD